MAGKGRASEPPGNYVAAASEDDPDAPFPATSVVLREEAVDELIAALRERGYETVGPVVRDGVVRHGPIVSLADLPRSVRDRQSTGHYRLELSDGVERFSYAVGPDSPKPSFFPPHETVFSLKLSDGNVDVSRSAAPARRRALFGVRPCDVAALAVLDQVMVGGSHPDPAYGARRDGTFIVAVECTAPAETCFCASMGTGPAAGGDFDIALCELVDGGHRFVARAGSPAGAELLGVIDKAPAAPGDEKERADRLDAARRSMTRSLPGDVAPLLARNVEHPEWGDVAERCLACGNCTMVCPTCFCSDIHDTSDVFGSISRQRRWSSCFELSHSYLSSGPVRRSVSSRYRQWATHKLSTWHDQFAMSGCVGCGRCITWCPAGIDLTAEVAAIARSDGAVATHERGRPS